MNGLMNGFLNLPAFWAEPAGSTALFLKIGVGLVIGIAMIFLLTMLPAQARRPLVVSVTFLAGLFWVMLWLWPSPQDRGPNDLPVGFTEQVGFWLADTTGEIGNVSNILTAFLLTLGVFSLFRMHITRLVKKQKNWFFSGVLLIAAVAMTIAGYWDWVTELGLQKTNPERAALLATDQSSWYTARYARDFLFDGLLQIMDAAMFSIIAFYILSAAYRAFRIRSIEATILLASALLVMLNLLGLAEFYWSQGVNVLTGNDPASFWNNLKLSEISGFIRQNLQSPGLRAIDFGIGIGMLAMALRLWLGLERGGVSS